MPDRRQSSYDTRRIAFAADPCRRLVERACVRFRAAGSSRIDGCDEVARGEPGECLAAAVHIGAEPELDGRSGSSVRVSAMSRAVEWLWKRSVPRGKVTPVAGQMGQAKSLWTIRLTAASSRSKRSPGQVVSRETGNRVRRSRP
jgi:hypothetical protein